MKKSEELEDLKGNPYHYIDRCSDYQFHHITPNVQQHHTTNLYNI